MAKRVVLQCLLAAGALGFAGCSGATLKSLFGTASGASGNATLVSISISPGTTAKAKGTYYQFTATAVYSDSTTADITAQANWSSADATIATIGSATGLAFGAAIGGPVTISATMNGVTGTSSFTVSAATLVSIGVTPGSSTIANGSTRQFTATGTYTDNTTQDLTSSVTWSSSSTGVASVNISGLATGAAAGSTNIQATCSSTACAGWASGTITSPAVALTVTSATLVSIAVTPASPTKSVGLTQQFTATGTYTDSSTQDLTSVVTWTSGTTSAATINSSGLGTAVAVGSSTITATCSNAVCPNNVGSGNKSGTATFTVTAASLVSIAVTPTNPTKAKGLTQQFTATGTYTDSTTQDITTTVAWTTSDGSVATVGAATGLGSAVGVGSATITATSGAISGNTTFTVTSATLVSIAVSPTNPSKAKGTTQQFTATGTYTDTTTQDLTTTVTWSSSNTTAATISNAGGSQGLASALAVGSTTITATSGAISGNTTFTVTAATLVSISVTPAGSSKATGLTQQFTATGTYTDSTTQDLTATVTWSSSNTTAATISNAGGSQGLASALGAGATTITATSGAISGNTGFTVTAATLVSIAVTPTNPSKAKGLTQQFTATGTYTDSTTQDLTASVTWSSSDISVATVSNAGGSQGLASAVNTGSATVTATSGAISGNTTFTVTSATLVSIAVTPTTPSKAKGLTQQFTATGTYSDSTTQDLTATATWSSSNTFISVISNAGGSQGLASALNVGSATITATSGAISGNTTITVTSATLASISVSPVNPSSPVGINRQFTATGIYTDNSTADITSTVTWSSVTTSVATISNAGGSQGLATPVAAGTSTITATSGAISGSTTLTVTTATLVAVTVSPSGPTIANGTTQQFTATAIYSDSTTQAITALVTWSSSNTGKATISNASGTNGLATAVAAGSTTITATYGGKSGTATLTVTSATLNSIAISPSSGTVVGLGTTQQFTATGTYSDGSTQNLTTLVTWSSSLTSVATISNAAGTNGIATSVAAGTTTVTAQLGAVSNTATLEVKTITLVSIAVTPANVSVTYGSTQQYTAIGTYSDSSTQDLTTQVTWSSDATAVATMNNSTPIGVLNTIAAGTANLTATRNGISGSTGVTVVADTTKPYISSAALSTTTAISVVFSKPVNISSSGGAGDATSYKVVKTLSGICADNTNFTSSTQTTDFSISSVTVVSTTQFTINISVGMTGSTYYVVADNTKIKDLASPVNSLGCPESASFVGLDTVPPYLVSASSVSATIVQINFSKVMLTGGGANAADNANNYKITTDGTCTNAALAVNSVSTVSSSVFQLNLGSSQSSVTYRVCVGTNVTDTAVPTPNAMGTPYYLTFTGNAQLYMVSAVALSTTTVKITFSKNVLTGGGTGSADCSDSTSCGLRYFFSPTLGSITSGVVGTGTSANTVTLTTTSAQSGTAYTVIGANATDSDGFTNGTVAIRNSANTENLQSAPLDRASFTGLGSAITTFAGGSLFSDPFVDGTAFAYAFTYGNSAVVGGQKVYLGTNAKNNAAFRFDANGGNSVQAAFNFSTVSGASCSTTTGFGYITSTITTAPTCGTNSGPIGEVGIVGFNSVSPVISGTTYDLLVAGPLKNGVSNIYYSQDLTTTLNWSTTTVTGTNGINSKSVQTIAATDNYVFIGISSDHNTVKPILNRYTATAGSGIVSLGSPTDLSINTQSVVGNNATSNGETEGIDAIKRHGSNLYLANNGGIVYTANWTVTTPTWTTVTPSTISGTTLVMPNSSSTDGGGLGKIRPGQRGVPILHVFNGKLYMARNVAAGSGTTNDKIVQRGELWKCNNSCTATSDWVRIVSGAETALSTSFTRTGTTTNASTTISGLSATSDLTAGMAVSGTGIPAGAFISSITNGTTIVLSAAATSGGTPTLTFTPVTTISMLQSNGSSNLYIGFDDPVNGLRIYQAACTEPSASTGSSGSTITTGACSGTGTADWTQQGSNGLGSTSNKYINSFTSIYDGLSNYIYVTAGDGSGAFKVFRQVN